MLFNPTVAAAAGASGPAAPFVIGGSIAAGLGAMLAKKLVGKGRRAADVWVPEENAFHQNYLAPLTKLYDTDPAGAQSQLGTAWSNYLQKAGQYGSQGSSQAQVAKQSILNLAKSLPSWLKLGSGTTPPYNPNAGGYPSGGGATPPAGGGGFELPPIPAGAQGGSGIAGLLGKIGLSPAELALLGVAGVGGALSGRGQSSTQTTTPTESPEYAGLGAALRQMVSGRLNQPLPEQYEFNGIKTINDTYDSIGEGLRSSLSSRGLSTSPMAGSAESNLALKRGGDIVNFQNQIPLVQDDLTNRNIAQAMQLYNAGRGSSSTARSSGSMLGGAFSDIGTALGYLLRQRQLAGAA